MLSLCPSPLRHRRPGVGGCWPRGSGSFAGARSTGSALPVKRIFYLIQGFITSKEGLYRDMSEGIQGKKGVVDRVVDVEQAGKHKGSDDAEMHAGTDKRPAKRGLESGSPSPTRQRPSSVTVDVETLRSLLAEQSASLLDKVMQGQREQIEAVSKELRQEIRQTEDTVKQELREQAKGLQELRSSHDDVLQRLQKLEQTNSSGSSTTMEPVNLERHKFTLIFGGWSKETPRRTVVDQLHKALQELELTGSTDHPGFTTGPRRALALMQFRTRSQEGFQGMRERMAHIMGTINRSTVIVRGGGKLWCGFSKSKQERDRGSHAALVRRVVRMLAPAAEAELECEYGTGSTWLSEYKFSSAAVHPDGVDKAGLMEFEPQVHGMVAPWIDVQAMARCLQVDAAAVRKAVDEQKRH